jgi:ribosomal protein S18 acetylase RimI-like enzyme
VTRETFGVELSDGSFEPKPASADEFDAVVDLILREQARPDRNVPSLGVDRVGVLAELEELSPPWTDTLRVICGADSKPVGVIFPDWSVEAGRAWINGPWIEADDDEWQALAKCLVEAALDQPPAEITSHVLSGDIAHHCMADLAAELGWTESRIDDVLVIDRSAAALWPDKTPTTKIRPIISADITSLTRLHDSEFPSTYYTTHELLQRADRGEHVVLVASARDGTLAGYVAARVQPDGEGFIDFVAVDERARRDGLGRHLVTAAVRHVLPLSATGRVCLTVRDDRTAARGLYQSLGFVVEAQTVGYASNVDAWKLRPLGAWST